MLKANHWFIVFLTLQSLEGPQVTDNRKASLAEKRKGRHIKSTQMLPSTSQTLAVRVGPSPPPQTEEEACHVTSISDPEISSAGYKLYHACEERESEALANQFFTITLASLFEKDPPLAWVTGRPKVPVVQWRSRYPPNI